MHPDGAECQAYVYAYLRDCIYAYMRAYMYPDGAERQAYVYAYMRACIYAYMHPDGAERQGVLPERGSCLSLPNVWSARPGGAT